MEPLVNGACLMSTDGCPQLWTTPVVPEFALHPVEMADLAQQPMGNKWVLVARLIKLPSCMCPAPGQLDVLFVAGEAGIRRIGIALHRALKIDRQHLVQARR